jgi:hypothetical protein
MPKRDLSHVDWRALRELIAKGMTLKELAKMSGISYRTLCSRSHRERWNVMAIRANLPTRSMTERKDLVGKDLRMEALKNGVTVPLVKLANFYQSADLQLLRNDSARFMAFVNAALKVLSWNDAKQAEVKNPVINLNVLAARPAELAAAQAREVETADSQSSCLPSSSEAVRPVSATTPLG